jgi:hypothetical protein
VLLAKAGADGIEEGQSLLGLIVGGCFDLHVGAQFVAATQHPVQSSLALVQDGEVLEATSAET